MGNTALVVSPYLYAKLPFEPLADFVPVTLVNSAPLLLVVHPSVPVQSVSELIAYAKARPGQLNYGSGGVGSTPYLATELLKSMAGIDAVHVPYKGGAPALNDLIGGQLSFMIENMPGTMPFVKSGKLRALAVTSLERSSVAPEVPTAAESGYPGFEALAWHGILAPAKTPPAIVKKLNEEIAKALQDSDTKALLVNQAMQVVGNTPEAFAAFIQKDIAIWKAVATAANVTVE